MRQDITTEELKLEARQSGKAFFKIAAFDADFDDTKTIGFLRELEEYFKNDVDLYVYTESIPDQLKILPSPSRPRYLGCRAALHGLHHDLLPYAEMVFSVPDNEHNAAVIKMLAEKNTVQPEKFL